MLINLSEYYEGNEMRHLRAKVAGHILQAKYEDADDILNFFSMVGIVVQKDSIDKEMVWGMFFPDLHPYYLALKTYISEERKEDPTVYQSVIDLDQTLSKYEPQKHLASWGQPRITDFLESEKKFLEKNVSNR